MRSSEKHLKRIAPRASALIESLRDVGYSLKTAVADVIDNSLAAGAEKIELLSDTESEYPMMGILDDGSGMSEEELLEAMRPGTKSPLADREAKDLGRFGLGLKTASFSQCRRLTVVTRKEGRTSCAAWDLDTVADENDWCVELPDDLSIVPWLERLPAKGTLVVWQKLDRLLEDASRSGRQNMIRKIDEAASHVEFVFHRFLSGEAVKGKSVRMLLNGRELEADEPFHSSHWATQRDPCEIFQFMGEKIHIQPFTLPHHSKVKNSEWEKYGRPEGYVKNQGFYLYRNYRLIVHGTWFGLARQSELTKLSRVRIDITNKLDAHWRIDVKKASAQIPGPVRTRLKTIIERITGTSKRVYTHKGAKLASNPKLPVWVRTQDKSQIQYRLNEEHPAFMFFVDKLAFEQAGDFRTLLQLIVSTLPLDSLFADFGQDAEAIDQQIADPGKFFDLVEWTYRGLRDNGIQSSEARTMMEAADPFRKSWAEVAAKVDELEMEYGNK